MGFVLYRKPRQDPIVAVVYYLRHPFLHREAVLACQEPAVEAVSPAGSVCRLLPCRYSALARTAKRILEKYNAQPLGVNARYACAYSTIEKRDW